MPAEQSFIGSVEGQLGRLRGNTAVFTVVRGGNQPSSALLMSNQADPGFMSLKTKRTTPAYGATNKP